MVVGPVGARVVVEPVGAEDEGLCVDEGVDEDVDELWVGVVGANVVGADVVGELCDVEDCVDELCDDDDEVP